MAASHSPDAESGTDDAPDSNDDDDYDAEAVAGGLKAEMTAEELRRFAAHSAASRKRGATKAETALQVAEGDHELAPAAAEGGDCSVTCSCGLAFNVAHPQTARSEAQAHKSGNPTHFPKATDESGDEPFSLYG